MRIFFANVYLIVAFIYNVNLFSQDETFIEIERLKTQEEFKESVEPQAIPQSQLIQELNKPGNEMLFEQFKNSTMNKNNEGQKVQAEDIQEQKDLESGLEDQEEKEVDEDKKVTDEDKDKKKVSSIIEMMFDRELYYKSVKDFYGYRIFFNTDPKKPVPVTGARSNMEHIVSPDDSFILSLWGSTEIRRRLTVSPEGTIFIENVGIISVHGMTVKELEEKLKEVLSKSYKTLNPQNGNPTTFLDITYDRLNTIVVFVNGEVVAPGPYELSSNSTIISAITSAGGVTAKGTLRDIQVIRNGEIIQHFDVYDYLHTGKDVLDILLRPNDNIFVKNRNNTVSLEGEVFNPLKYELKPNETLKDLIQYSGGLLSSASIDLVKIERITPKEDRNSPVVFSSIINEPFTSNKNGNVEVNPIELRDLDVVTISPLPKMLSNFVVINGAVYRGGRYEFKKGMTISDLINKTGGLLADAFLSKVELIRTYPNTKNEYMSLNLNVPADMNLELQSLDSINIYSEWKLKNKKMVLVTGYIRQPGFTLLNDSTRVSDLIFSRGGIEDEDQRKMTLMKRADIIRFNEDGLTTKVIPINLEKALNGDKDHNLILENNDHLRVYNVNVVFEKKQVYISGYIREEGEYNLSTNMTVQDLILAANGFKEGAYKDKADVFRKVKESDLLSQVYHVDLNKDLFSVEKNNGEFFLQDKDHVVIRKDPEKENLKAVYLTGEVKFPGIYTIQKRNETFRELIQRAGGLSEEAFIDGTEYFRDSTRIVSDFKKAVFGNSKNDILLRDKDQINVPSHPGTVIVEGFVYTPGYVKYRSDWSPSDYVEAAGGGINELEYEAGDAIVYYPGGNAKVNDGWLFSPEVKEGSRIVVPKNIRQPETEWAGEIRTWLAVLTSTLTVVVLVAALQNDQ